MRSVRSALLLSLCVSSCAVGLDTGDGLMGVDAGGRADAASPDGSVGDDGAGPADTGTTPDEGTADTGVTETGAGDGGPAGDAGAGDSGGAKDGAADTSVSDGGCPGHGITGVLVAFDLSTQAGSETSAPATMSATGVTGGALARSAALTPVSGAGSINSSAWPTAASADASHYYTFTVTPAAGCSITLTSLAVDVSASSTGPAKADVATSGDAFATHTASFSGTSKTTVPLTGATGTGAIEVRVYGYSATGSGGTLRIQNTLTLSGSID